MKAYLVTLVGLMSMVNLSAKGLNPEDILCLIELKENKDSTLYYDTILKILDNKKINIDDPDQMNQIIKFSEIPKTLNAKTKLLLRRIYMNLAFKYQDRSKYLTALPLYLKAHYLAEDPICLDKYAHWIENPLANIYTRLDDFDKASYFFNLYLQSSAYHKDSTKLSLAYQGSALCYYSMKDLSKAKVHFNLGYHIASRIKNRRGMTSNYLGLAQIMLDEQKMDSFELIITACDNITNDTINFTNKSTYCNNIAFLKSAFYISKKEFDKGISLQKIAIDTFLKLNTTNSNTREMAKHYYTLGKYYLKDQNTDSAIIYYIKAMSALLPNTNQTWEIADKNLFYWENTFIELLKLRADILQFLYTKKEEIKILDEEIKTYEAIFAINNNRIENIMGDASKLISIEDQKEIIGRCLKSLAIIYQHDPSLHVLERIRNVFDQSKALLVNDKIQQIEKFNKMPIEIKSRIQKYYTSYYELRLNNQASTNEATEYLIKIDDLLKRSDNSPYIKNTTFDYVEYAYQEDSIYAYSNIDHKNNFKSLGSKIIFDSLFTRLQHELQDNNHFKDRKIFHDLALFLLPETTFRNIKNLCIIPDGPIAYIPFDALEMDSSQAMIHQCNIYYRLQLNQANNNSINQSISSVMTLVPNYSSTGETSHKSTLNALQYTASENAEIIKLFHNTKTLDPKITKKNLMKKLFQNSGIFHFAGHGLNREDSSYLLLENGIEKFTYQDISNLYNQMDMVVLSACETGLGAWDPGDGSRSVCKAFIEAGSKSVISTLWQINDQSHSMIINQFYKNIHDGQDKSTALRDAKIKFLNQASMESIHPYYWSSYTATGNMAPIKFVSVTKKIFLIIGVTLSLLLIIWIIKQYLLKQKSSL